MASEKPTTTTTTTTPTAPTTPKQPEFVDYISKESEPMKFDVAYPGGGWNCEEKRGDGRLRWSVPSDQTKFFEKHHFYKNGRIQRL